MNYKNYWKKERFVLKEALIHVTIVSLIIIMVAFFSPKLEFIGLVLVGLGFLPLMSLKITGEKIKESISEIVFGIVNTGLITVAAIVGFEIEGILGAVVGVALGDAITEGYSGILEGEIADIMLKHKIKEKIDPLNSSLGKMAGALFGGGIVLFIFSIIF